MKPIKLVIDGINSYNTKQEIDFLKLTEKGLFGIFGKTGSGKSTILDSITLALYGQIPRKTVEYINSDRNKAVVEYEFEIGSKDNRSVYMVSRRFKKSGKNSTRTDYARLMKKNDDGEYDVVEDGKTYVDSAIRDIIGLSYDDFLRSVVLPQGKFSEFLTLGGKNRRDMLERIFKLGEYGSELNDRIAKRRIGVSNEIDILNARLGEYSEIDDDLENILEKEAKEKKGQYILLKEKKEEELKKLEEGREIFDLLSNRDKEIEIRNGLDEKREEINNIQTILDDNKVATMIKPSILEKRSLSCEIKKLDEDLKSLSKLHEEAEKNLENFRKEFGNYSMKKDGLVKIAEIRNILSHIFETLNNKSLSLNIIKKSNDDIYKLNETLKAMVEERDRLQNDLKEIEDTGKNIGEKIEDFNEKSIYRRDIDNYINELSDDLNKLDKIEKLGLDIVSSRERLKDLHHEKKELEDERDNLDIEEMSYKIKEIIKKQGMEICPVCNNHLHKEILGENGDESICSLGDTVGCNQDLVKTDFIEEVCVDSIENIYKKEVVTHLKKIELDIRRIEEDIVKKETTISMYKKSISHSLDNIFKNLRENAYVLEDIKKSGIEENSKDNMEKNSEAVSNEDYTFNMGYLEKFEDDSMEKNLEAVSNEDYTFNKGVLDRSKILKIHERLKKISDENKKKSDEILKLIDDRNRLRERYKDKLKQHEEYTKIINAEDKRLVQLQSNIESHTESVKIADQKIEEGKNKIYILCKNNENIVTEIKNISGIDIMDIEKNIDTHENIDTKKNIDTQKNIDAKRNIDIQKNIDTHESIDAQKDIEINELIDKLVKYEDYVSKKFNDLRMIIESSQKDYNLQKDRLLSTKTQYDVKFDLEAKKSDEIKSLLDKYEFADEDDVLSKCIEEDVEKNYKKIVDDYNKSVSESKIRYEIIIEKLAGRKIDKEELFKMEENFSILEKDVDTIYADFVRTEKRLMDVQEAMKTIGEINKILSTKKKLLSNIKVIEDLFRGNRFVEYLSQLYLKNIVIDASTRLYEITNGRYVLEIGDNYQFVISDNFNGGIRRAADTLSGGEIFLTSLSLALALSSQIQLKGSAPLEFFFLDEGFGTLDAQLLNLVMESLEKLHSKTLSVGIISHVDEIKDRIPIKLIVKMDEENSSSVVKIVET